MTTPLYPLFLKLAGKRAVVVGAGRVGLHKAAELAGSGARVVVIAERFAGEVPAGVEAHVRAFAAGDTRGAVVVVAATGVRAVDEAVAADARAHGALVNAVDNVEASDFYTGAVVRRGPLLVVVGTSGASPALARKVRERLEHALPPGLAVLADALGRARPRLLERFPVFAERARLLDAFVERAWFRFLAGPTDATDDDDLRAKLERALAELLCTSP